MAFKLFLTFVISFGANILFQFKKKKYQCHKNEQKNKVKIENKIIMKTESAKE